MTDALQGVVSPASHAVLEADQRKSSGIQLLRFDLALQREPVRAISIFLAYFLNLIYLVKPGHRTNSKVIQRSPYPEEQQCPCPTTVWLTAYAMRSAVVKREALPWDIMFHSIQLSNLALLLDFQFLILQWTREAAVRAGRSDCSFNHSSLIKSLLKNISFCYTQLL